MLNKVISEVHLIELNLNRRFFSKNVIKMTDFEYLQFDNCAYRQPKIKVVPVSPSGCRWSPFDLRFVTKRERDRFYNEQALSKSMFM